MAEQASSWHCPRCDRTWISATGFSTDRCPGCKRRKNNIQSRAYRPYGQITPEQRAEERREYQRNLSAEQRAHKAEAKRRWRLENPEKYAAQQAKRKRPPRTREQKDRRNAQLREARKLAKALSDA